jgi:tetratricopeptide (TPR) repeat protein
VTDPTVRGVEVGGEPGRESPGAPGEAVADRLVERAWVVFGQRRFDLAEQQLGEALTADPHHAGAHALLALCHSEVERSKDAIREARTAVGLDPEGAWSQYVLARVLADANRLSEALPVVREAIARDPRNPSFRATLARIELQRGRAREALAAAEEGLALDPEDTNSLRMRQLALVNLGRTGEAAAASHNVLAADPESGISHATKGWAQLNAGDVRSALDSFREALRITPNLDFARAGLVEAMKARNPVYGALLRWFLWLARLGPRERLIVALALPFVFRALRTVVRNDPTLAPIVVPLMVVYVAFIFATWLASPLFDLVLRLDPLGRHALDEDDIRQSNVIGVLLVGAAAGVIAGIVTGLDAGLYVGLGCLALCIPVVTYFELGERGRTMMYLVLAAVGGAMLGAVGLALQSQSRGFDDERALVVFALAGGLALLSGWTSVIASVRMQRS